MKIKSVIARNLNISPVFIQLILVERDELGIVTIFENLLNGRKYVIEMRKDFRLLNCYPI